MSSTNRSWIKILGKKFLANRAARRSEVASPVEKAKIRPTLEALESRITPAYLNAAPANVIFANSQLVTLTGGFFDANASGDVVTFANGGVTGSVVSATGSYGATATVAVTGLSNVISGTELTASITVDGTLASGSPAAVGVVTPVVTPNATSVPATSATLTIHGFGFDPTAAHDSVTFNNGVSGSVTAATGTSLTLNVTGLSGVGPTIPLDAVVTVDGTSSGAGVEVATVTGGAPPAITASTAPLPDSATTITINGTGFAANSANDTVSFNLGVTGTLTSASTTQLTVTILTPPTQLGELDAVVTTYGSLSTASVQVATESNGTWTVTDSGDTAGSFSDITFRYALGVALNGDSIAFDSSLNGSTISLSSTLNVTSNVTIVGLGEQNLAINGGFPTNTTTNGGFGDFNIAPGVTASISGLTIEGGQSSGGGINNNGTLTLSMSNVANNSNGYGYAGGGILNSGTLTIYDSAVDGNQSYYDGAGIFNQSSGTLTVSNSTIYNNGYWTNGGGIDNQGMLTLSNSTITGNTGWRGNGFGTNGGGIYNTGTLVLTNTIIAGNVANNGSQDIVGTVAVANNSLIDNTNGFSISAGANNLLGVNADVSPNGDITYFSPAIQAGGPLTTLTAPIGASDTTIFVQNAASIAVTPGDYTITIGQEQLLVTNVNTSNNSLTVVRGYNGTTPTAESSGAGITFPFDERGVAATTPPTIGAITIPTLIVTDPSGGAGSATDVTLPYAISQGPDVIEFAASLSGDTIYLNGTLNITTDIEIIGLGANELAIDGGSQPDSYNGNGFGDINVSSGVTASISGLTIQGGQASGGGINNNGTLTLSMSAVSNNSNGYGYAGGGILNGGVMTIFDSTITGNQTYYDGAGIFNRGNLTVANTTIADNGYWTNGGGIDNQGTLSLTNSTITGTTGWRGEGFGTNGGGIYNSGVATLSNDIISGNVASSGSTAVKGTILAANNNILDSSNGLTITAGSGNQIGVNPGLASSLAYNGGPTETVALLAGSPAIATGGAVTTLTAPIGSTDTTIYVQDASLIASTAGSYPIFIGAEELLVTNVNTSNNSLTVVRGYNGTTAAAAATSASVYLATDQTGKAASIPPDIGAYTVPALIVTDPGSGAGSATDVTLPYAVANALGVILFAPSLSGDTITLTSTLSVPYSVDIIGLGAASLAISGGHGVPIFSVPSGVALGLSGVTLENGLGVDGGAINNSGTLNLTNDTLTGNSAVIGGAIYNTGTLNLADCTLSGNNASQSGSGIYTGPGSSLTISAKVASTIGDNIVTAGSGLTLTGAGVITISGNINLGTQGTLTDTASGQDTISGIISGTATTFSTSTPGLIGTYFNLPYGSGTSPLIQPASASNASWLGNQTPAVTAQLVGPIDFPDIATNGFVDNVSGDPTYYNLGNGNNNNVEGRWYGDITIPGTGTTPIPVDFATTSDDGSALYIDGTEVVNNDFNQGATQRTGVIDLTPGLHTIDIEYYQGGGGASMVASWDPTGTNTFSVIPFSAFSTVTSYDGVTMSGSGSLTLTHVNTYQGPTTIDSGSLVVTTNGATGGHTAAGITVYSGGSLGLAGNIDYTDAEPLLINGLGANGNGAIENYSGNNTLGIPITLTNSAAIGSRSGTLTVADPISGGSTASLILDGAGTTDVIAPITVGSGGLVLLGDGTINVSSSVNLGTSGGVFAEQSGAATISGVITGTGSANELVMAGAGTLTLTQTNSYLGTTTINDGTLVVTADGALGSGTAGIFITSGGALGFSGGVDYNTGEPITINGSGPAGAGAIVNISGNNTLTTDIVLGAAAAIGSNAGLLTLTGGINIGLAGNITFTGSGNITETGVIAGTDPVPFTPADIPGLQYELDASDSTSLVTTGSNVTQWSDLSGNSNNFTAAGSTTTGNNSTTPLTNTDPVVTSDEFGSLPGLHFYGNSAPTQLTGAANVNVQTIILVLNVTSENTGDDGVWGAASNNPAGGNVDESLRMGGSAFHGNPGDGGNSADYNNINPVNGSDGTTYITSQSSFDVNSTSFTFGSPFIVEATGNLTPALTEIGGGSYQGRWLDGYVGEVVAYNTQLSTTQRQEVEEYLSNEWLGTNLGGPAGVIKTGTGTTTLTSTNTYYGATTISGGKLAVTANGALGYASDSGITVTSGGALALSSGLNYSDAEPLTLAGSGPAGKGALENGGGSSTFAGTIKLSAPATIGSDAGTLTLPASPVNITAGNLTTVGAGNIVIGGSIQGVSPLAYVGFTGATGGANSTQDILNWTFTSPGTSINDSAGFTAGGLDINGSGSLSGTELQLTSGVNSQDTSAWTPTTVNVSSFTTTFQFTYGSNPQADGFTFAVQDQGNTALGSAGGSLGYSGISGPSAAAEFNLYDGVSTFGLGLDGAIDDHDIDLTAYGINFHNNPTDTYQATIVDNGLGSVTVSIWDLTSNSSSTPNFSQSFAIPPSLPSGLVVNSTGTVTVANASNTYAGPTTVNSGVLVVNGALANTSGVTVNSGATLAGTGSTPAGLVVTGGVVNPSSPLNTPGTLAVGSANFASLGNLTADITSSSNSVLSVTGALTLGGTSTLSLNLAGLNLSQSATYTISTDGSVSGQFAGLYLYNNTNDYQAVVSYTATAVKVTLTPPTAATATIEADTGSNPSQLNAPATFTVSVTNPLSTAGQTVQIEDASNGDAVVATPTLTNGTATFSISSLAVGSHNLFAVYTRPGGISYSNLVTQVVLTPLVVNSVTATPSGFVLLFNEPINPYSTVLYSSPGDTTLGAADITVVGATAGTLRGSLVIDPTNPDEATFVQTSGLLAPDTYTVTVTTAVTGVAGNQLTSNYTTPIVVAATTSPVLSVPSFARGPGQTVALNDTLGDLPTGIPVNISGATSVTSASFSLTYNPTLLTIAPTGALVLSSAATAAGINTVSYTITAGADADHSTLTVTLSSSGTGTGLTTTAPETLATILASVPATATYIDKAVLGLAGGVTVNGSPGAGVSGVEVVAYLGDVLGTGLANATGASLVDQVASGAGTGFSAFKDLDPVIIGGVEGGAFVNATDASLINEAAAGQTISQIPSVPTLPSGVTLAFGGPDPYLYLSAVQGAPGQTVTETLYLDVTDPNGIQLTALDEAIGFDAGALHISNVRSAPGLAGLGSYNTADAVDNSTGVLLVGQAFEGIGLPPLVPYGTDVAVLQFDVTLSADATPGEVSGLTLLQDGSVNGQLKYTAISDNEGALTFTPGKSPSNSGNAAIDGTVTVVTTPAVAEVVVSNQQQPTAVQPRSGIPVRRATSASQTTQTPGSSTNVSSVVTAEIVVEEVFINATVLPNVGPSVTGQLNSVALEVSTASAPQTATPSTTAELAQLASAAVNTPKSADSGAALSLTAMSASKTTPVAPATTVVKSSTAVLDEMYRLLFTTGQPVDGWNLGDAGEDGTEELFGSFFQEYSVVDQDADQGETGK